MLWRVLDFTLKWRPYGPVLGALSMIGTLTAFASGMLFFDWLLVTYPGRTDFGIYEQSTPSWLWQLGFALIAAGCALMAGAAVAGDIADRRRPSAPRRTAGSERLYTAMLLVALNALAVWMAAVTVQAVPTSELRSHAWLSVGCAAIVSVIGWRYSTD